MVFKKLKELTANELRTELKRAGIQGKYVKTEAVMRLTTHLIDVSEDPLTFEFDPDIPIQNAEEDNDGTYEVTNDASDTVTVTEAAGGSAASVSELLNAIVSSAASVTIAGGLPTTASSFVSSTSSASIPTTTSTFVTSTSSASLTTSTFTTSTTAASSHIMNAGMGHYPAASGVQMYNPYNPNLPINPGMPQYPQYPGMPQYQQYPGMQMPYPWPQAMPPMSGVGSWSPWGGWTTPSPSPAAPMSSAVAAGVPAPTSGTSFAINSAMTDFTGACPPPARSSETKSTKILSGQYDTARREVKERQNWPQVMIDHILNPETIDYDDMDWAVLTAGMTGKTLAEMDPTKMDQATVNKIKHLNRLSNYGMKTPMKSILNFNAVLFRAIENKALVWTNWEKIDQFHTRHLSSLTVAAATSGAARAPAGSGSGGGQGAARGGQGKKPDWNTLRASMSDHQICFKFNKGKCDQEDDHDLSGDGRILIHACGSCTYAKRGIVKNHGAQECKPDFWPAPFRSQHRATGGGAVQQS